MRRLVFAISIILAASGSSAGSSSYGYLQIQQRHQRYLEDEQKKKDIVDGAFRKKQLDARIAEMRRFDDRDQKRRASARRQRRHQKQSGSN